MAKPTVLVTGAAGGRQGSTGNHVSRLLRARGIPVRALVHRIDERSDALRDLGVEIVAGDLLDLAFVRTLMTGVQRAYFAYPVQDGLMEATTIFATAAREAGLQRLVNLSQLLQRDGIEPTPHQSRHWLAEQIFDWAGIGVVHLDATVFFENLRALARGSIAAVGAVVLPWGPENTVFPMVSAEDVSRVAAGLLASDKAMPNGTVIPLIGDAVRVGDIAVAFSDVLGRPVSYREISDDQWVQNITAAGLSATVVEHLTHLWRFIRTRAPEFQAQYEASDAIARIGGSAPTSLRQYLAEQRQTFVSGATPSATIPATVNNSGNRFA
jgi:uncharacterized protein YbjT (DUF2867 family)